MRLSDRERRLVTVLGISFAVWLVIFNWGGEDAPVGPVPSSDPASIEAAQLRLDRTRALAARLPAASEDLKRAEQTLAVWEKRLIVAETPAQATAQLLTIFRRLARSQGDAIVLRSADLGTLSAAGEYAEIAMNIALDCRIESLVNLLADLTAQPELIAWRDLKIASSDPKSKRLNVVFVLLARSPKRLAPKASTATANLGAYQ
jgi:hypothetical protein